MLLKELVDQTKMVESVADKYTKFGEFVAEELRQLGSDAAFKQAKRRIQLVLFEIADQHENTQQMSVPPSIPSQSASANSIPFMESQSQNGYGEPVSSVLSYTNSLFDMDS